MTTLIVALIVVAWVLIGLIAGLWMMRRGPDLMWIALVLGPLFVPIAWERVERHLLSTTGPSVRSTERKAAVDGVVGTAGTGSGAVSAS